MVSYLRLGFVIACLAFAYRFDKHVQTVNDSSRILKIQKLEKLHDHKNRVPPEKGAHAKVTVLGNLSVVRPSDSLNVFVQ